LAAALGLGALPASAQPATTSAATAVAAATAQPSITMRAPTSVEAGQLLTVTGVARPVRLAAPVQLWELRGSSWVPIAESGQAKNGSFAVRMRAGRLGRHVYRVATEDSRYRFSIRSAVAVVTTVRPSSSGVRSTRLAATTPLGAYVGQRRDGEPAPYGIGTYRISGTPTVRGRAYPDSVRTISADFSYELGAHAATFGAAVSLAPIQPYVGPRLVEIRVDDVVRVRRFVRDGQAFPVRIDVRGKRVVRIITESSGSLIEGPGSYVLLGTPVVTSRVLSERGVLTSTVLSNLRATAVSGPVRLNQVEGAIGRELLGGSINLAGPQRGSATGSVSYDLRGKYRRLVGVPAIFGETHTILRGRVRLYGDGRLLADLPAPLWSYRRSQVDVTGVQRLRIDLSASLSDATQWWNYSWFVVWGDGRLT
jgi:hypothetical protein